MPLSDRGETGIGFAVARNAVVGDFAVDAVYMPGYAPGFPVYGQQFGVRRVVPAADFRFAGQVFFGQFVRDLSGFHVYRPADGVAAVKYGGGRFMYGDFIGHKGMDGGRQVAAEGCRIRNAQAVFHQFHPCTAKAADLRCAVARTEAAVLYAADSFYCLPQRGAAGGFQFLSVQNVQRIFTSAVQAAAALRRPFAGYGYFGKFPSLHIFGI